MRQGERVKKKLCKHWINPLSPRATVDKAAFANLYNGTLVQLEASAGK